MDDIVNRVAKSPLVNIDLESFYPKEPIIGLDISQWLDSGMVLREKSFRQILKEYDWSQYTDKRVYLFCSTDAILPGWANLLVTTYLSPYAIEVSLGSKEMLLNDYYTKLIYTMDCKVYMGQKLIIKGCSNKQIPENAYVQLVNKLMPYAQSLMFGEPCSTVPLYKHNS